MTKKFAILYSDVEMGVPDFGFIQRNARLQNPEDACDAEDVRFERYLAKKGIKARCVDGYIWVD